MRSNVLVKPSITTPVARTPLYDWHAAHGARFEVRKGWEMPTVYSSPEGEAEEARRDLGLADISAFAKRSFRGKGVPGVVERMPLDGSAATPRGVARLDAPEPALVCRLTADHLLLIALTEEGLPIIPTAELELPVTDVTSAYAGFCVAGPRTEELLRRLTALDVRQSAFPANSCAETSLAGVEALLVRAPELSVPAMRLYVAWDFAEYVWERLLEAGRDLGVSPLGPEGLRLLAGN
jgi:heterotetrameric sarcosine oxidase gamma subunit